MKDMTEFDGLANDPIALIAGKGNYALVAAKGNYARLRMSPQGGQLSLAGEAALLAPLS